MAPVAVLSLLHTREVWVHMLQCACPVMSEGLPPEPRHSTSTWASRLSSGTLRAFHFSGAAGEKLSACPQASSQGRGPRTSPWVSPVLCALAAYQVLWLVITFAFVIGEV